MDFDDSDYYNIIKEKITPWQVDKEIKQVNKEIKICIDCWAKEEAQELVIERNILQQIKDFISSLLN